MRADIETSRSAIAFIGLGAVNSTCNGEAPFDQPRNLLGPLRGHGDVPRRRGAGLGPHSAATGVLGSTSSPDLRREGGRGQPQERLPGRPDVLL